MFDYRPKPFYFITDAREEALTENAVNTAVAGMKELGYGGFVLFNKPPTGFTGEEFLGPRYFQTVRRFAEAAVNNGLEIFLNDGLDCPPGDAGGRIAEIAPELRQRYLKLNAGGDVEVVEADWGFPAFEEEESSRLFIELVYEAHKREVGDYLGNGISGFFSDADNRRVAWGRFKAMGSRNYFPWSRQFAAKFKDRFGYDIEPHLKAVLTDADPKVAADYWYFAGWLYQQWFAANQRWCHENGLTYLFHSSDTGLLRREFYPRSSSFTEGNPFELQQYSDRPGVDQELAVLGRHAMGEHIPIPYAFWGGYGMFERGNELYRLQRGAVKAQLAQSAAFFQRKSGTMCEMFAGTNWSATPALLRDIAVKEIMQGINFIIPHAVHHRSWEETKYFAPPDLSFRLNWHQALPDFNAHLTQLCSLAAEGEPVAKIAVVYPLQALWRRHVDTNRFYAVAEALNRLPHGYVIATPEMLLSSEHRFDYVVNTGEELSPLLKKQLRDRGTVLLEAEELDRIQPDHDCAWQGNGVSPHYLRRRLPQGEILMIANIENEFPMRGILRWRQMEYSIILESGEVAWFHPDGSHQYRTPQDPVYEEALPPAATVIWGAPNSLSLLRWETPAGRALGGNLPENDWNYSSEPVKTMDFAWECNEEVGELTFLLPLSPRAPVSGVLLNGTPLASNSVTRVGDDEFRAYKLPDGHLPGRHRLRLERPEAAPWPYDALSYLTGEFDAAVNIAGPCVAKYGRFMFQTDLPAYASVILSKRRCQLDITESWADQGHPFYTGAATYKFEVELSGHGEQAQLYLPWVVAIAEIHWDGISLGRRYWSPFSWKLPDLCGKHHLNITVHNTNANALDGFRELSGILAGGKIQYFEERKQ